MTLASSTRAVAIARPVAHLGRGRRALASAGSLTAAAAIPVMMALSPFGPDMEDALVLSIPTALCTLATFLLHRRHLGSQILARATWWSNLILGMLISISGSGAEGEVAGPMLALGCGLALLTMGRAGLDEEVPAGRFHPVAFRGSLILALVMALADTQSLLFFGVLSFAVEQPSVLPLVCAATMILAVLGLYRLAVWGLALNLVANVAIAGLGLAGALGLPDPIVAALVATAVLQLLVPLPLLVGLVRGAPARPRHGRSSWPVLATGVVMLMALSVYGAYLHPGRLVHF